MKLTNSLGFALHNAIISLVVLSGAGAIVAEKINDEIIPAAHATVDKSNCTILNDKIALINEYGTDDAGWEAAVAIEANGGGGPVTPAIVRKTATLTVVEPPPVISMTIQSQALPRPGMEAWIEASPVTTRTFQVQSVNP